MKTGWFRMPPEYGTILMRIRGPWLLATRNIRGTDYTFDSSGAWVTAKVRLNDGWNGTTYVNRLVGYQITLPDSYQAVSGNSVPAGKCAV